jgi:hypothetical protein
MKIPLVVLAAALTAGELSGQALQAVGSASIVSTRVRSQVPPQIDQFTGSAFLGEGALSMGRLRLSASYLQGTINPNGGTATARDLVEGTVLVGVRTLDWLTIEGGPHARAYSLAGGTQRWLFWELRARAATAFVGSAAQGYAELWRAVAANANVPEPFDHAQGGEVGMILRLARAPVAARLGYRVDHAVLGGGTRLETVDGVVIGVGVSGLP